MGENVIDHHWFWGRMHNDGLIVRMHVGTPRDKAPITEARVFGCWYDDMHPNRFEMIYRHDDDKSHRAISPLELISWGYFDGTWQQLFEELTRGWSNAWREEEDVVCTIGPTRKSGRKLKPGNPLALTHLARLQTAVALSPDESFSTSRSIVTRRVGGIIRANLKIWEGLVG